MYGVCMPVGELLFCPFKLPIQGVVWFSESWLAESPESFDAIGTWSRERMNR